MIPWWTLLVVGTFMFCVGYRLGYGCSWIDENTFEAQAAIIADLVRRLNEAKNDDA